MNDTLVVIGTGGTISGKASRPGDMVGYVAGQVAVDDLLDGVPVPSGVGVECVQVAQIDSKDMGPEVWKPLLACLAQHLHRPEVRGVVITHGTDTLEETAYLLQAVLNPGKPVVLTCAMRPATALVPDGPQNLADALRVAATPDARGVVVVCAGQIHSGLDVQKVHTFRLAAFDSGDAGALGCVEPDGVVLWRAWPDTGAAHDRSWLDRLLAAPHWPRVEWVISHGGADGAIVRALLSHRVPEARPLQGLLVAGTGNGTLHRELEASLLEAQAAGVAVRRSTRCAQGRVMPREEGSPIAHSSLPPAKARLALMLELLGR